MSNDFLPATLFLSTTGNYPRISLVQLVPHNLLQGVVYEFLIFPYSEAEFQAIYTQPGYLPE